MLGAEGGGSSSSSSSNIPRVLSPSKAPREAGEVAGEGLSSGLTLEDVVAILRTSSAELELVLDVATLDACSLCSVRYDSKACKLRAAAAAELGGNSAACCKDDMMAFCRDKATFCRDRCRSLSLSVLSSLCIVNVQDTCAGIRRH